MMHTHVPAPLTVDRLSMNLISLGAQRDFAAMLDACLAHDIRCVAPWQMHYQDIGIQAAAAHIHARELQVSGLCRLSEFGQADTPARWAAALETAKRTLDEAAALGAQTITFIGGHLAAGSKDLHASRQRIVEGAHAIAPWFQAYGIQMAIEPLHPMALATRGGVGTLSTALALAQQLGDCAGVLVDTYNQWWDPAMPEVLAAAQGKIACYQVSDWLPDTLDLVFDRGLMGDGVIDFLPLRAQVEAAGYQGAIEIEMLSRRYDALPLDELVALLISRAVAHC